MPDVLLIDIIRNNTVSYTHLDVYKRQQLIGIPLLHRQLRKRFGELPDWVETRLQEATTAQLELWAEQLLDAETLEGVFQESR